MVDLLARPFRRNFECGMSAKYSYVIDMEGFMDNGGGFLPKEVAVVCLTGGHADYWILDQPYLETKLTDATRIENKWLTQSTHGLEWKQGDIPYIWIFTRLRQLSLTANRIYVYGADRRKFL